jgi:CRISPR-associated protein Cas1
VRYLESGRTVRLPIDQTLRQEVEQAIGRARALRLQTIRPPVTTNERLCPRCSLAPVCLPEEERLAKDPTRQTVRLFPPHADRMIVHVLEHGAHVGRKEDRLVVRLPKDGTEASYPIHQVESVVVHGYGQISTQALRLCADHEVAVQWMTGSGMVMGAFVQFAHSAQRHLRQFRALESEPERLRLSRQLVTAKVDAQFHFLQRGLRGDDRPDGGELLARIRHKLRQVDSAELDTLLGLEGAAAAAYFEGLSLLLKPDLDVRLRYVRRSRRPAADRFNALLNYLYGMLYRQVLGSILAVGLHPGVGTPTSGCTSSRSRSSAPSSM